MESIYLDNVTLEGKLTGIKIEKGIIKAIGPNQSLEGHQYIDCTGKVAVPGFVDIHVHLREPGQTNKETVKTGTLAAARGGYTRVYTMANSLPPLDNKHTITQLKETIVKDGWVETGFWGAVTKGLGGQELTDFNELIAMGVIGLSDDGMGIPDINIMERAMKLAKELDIVLSAHCEDHDEIKGVIHKGEKALEWGLPGISKESEWKVLQRDIKLLENIKCRYHVCHVSTAQSVKLIREAKDKGLPITCEVTPHHLVLTDKDIKLHGNFKMNPPIRDEEDNMALWEGLLDGTIDCIATDHAPHTSEEKEMDLIRAPFGIIGLETAFSLLYTHGVLKNKISLELLINKMSGAPCKIVNVDSPKIKEGFNCNLSIIDLDRFHPVKEEELLSKSKNSPFIGWDLKGWVMATLYNGKLVYNNLV
jgi:dihydroorotase